MVLPFPEINASLNGLAAIFLVIGALFIRAGNREAHRNCMVTAFVVSTLFLISYLTYHVSTGARTPFGGTGIWIPVYYRTPVSP